MYQFNRFNAQYESAKCVRVSECTFNNFSLFAVWRRRLFWRLRTKNSSHRTTTQRKEGRKPQKKESHPMASFAEAPAGDVAKGTRYAGFLLTFLPSFVFLRDSFYWRIVSLFLFYFRTHRREDFQDEVRAVPRRRTGGRTQTGTRVCFRRHLFSDTLWRVWEERVTRMFEQFRSIVRSDLVVPDALSSRLDLFSTRSILGGTRARWNVASFSSSGWERSERSLKRRKLTHVLLCLLLS